MRVNNQWCLVFLLAFTASCASVRPERRGGGSHRAAVSPDFEQTSGPVTRSQSAIKNASNARIDPGPAESLPTRSEAATLDEPVIGDAPLQGNANIPFGLPVLKGQQKSILIARKQYVISWNPETRAANWAAWTLSKEDLNPNVRRENFTTDADLTAELAKSGQKPVVSHDYSRTCFDRGHMVAAADRKGSDVDALSVSVMTNIIPQTAFLNRVIWVRFEDQVRDWIADGMHDRLWIIAGPIYDKTNSYLTESSKIRVSQRNFKAVYTFDGQQPKLLKAYIMPNLTSKGTDPVVDRETTCYEQSHSARTAGEEELSADYTTYEAMIPALEKAAGIQLIP